MNQTKQQYIKQIKELADKARQILHNTSTPLKKGELARQLGVSAGVISNLVSNGLLTMSSLEQQKEKYIKKALQEGKKLFEIASEVGLLGSSLYSLLKKEGLDSHQPPVLSALEIKALQDSLPTMDEKTRTIVTGVLEGKTIITLGTKTSLTTLNHNTSLLFKIV